METQEIMMIFVADEDYGIGYQGKMAWRFRAETEFFKNTTWGYDVVMGTETWKSLTKKYQPLPGRPNHIVSRNGLQEEVPVGVQIHRSPEDVLAALEGKDFFVMGGGQIYSAFAQHATCIIMSKIHRKYETDCKFDKTILENFTEDMSHERTLCEKTEDTPLITVHYFYRNTKEVPL